MTVTGGDLGVAAYLVALGGWLWRRESVRWDGAVVGTVLGFWLWWAGGVRVFAAFGVLVVLGSWLSHRGRTPDRAPPRRTAWQALANAGVAAGVLVWHPGDAGVLAAVSALGAAFSDTVSSEVGPGRDGTTRRCLVGRPVTPGSDGGMSMRGTIAGLVAAVGVGSLMADRGVGPVALVSGCAFVGNLGDSFLGATVQRSIPFHGNDLVNLMATGLAAGVALGCSEILL